MKTEKRRKREKQGAGAQPSYPGSFSRLLQHRDHIVSLFFLPHQSTKGSIWVRKVKVQFLRGQGSYARVILVLHECIWNATTVLLVLPAFDDTSLLGSPLHHMVYRPSVSLLVTASHFLSRNREAELKPITFSSLLRFHVFLSFLF